MSWLLRAACRGMDPALFHPERGQSAEPAKAVCRTCPVRVECLEVALAANERLGVWGGTSERERRSIRASRRTVVAHCRWWRCREPFVPDQPQQRYCRAEHRIEADRERKRLDSGRLPSERPKAG